MVKARAGRYDCSDTADPPRAIACPRVVPAIRGCPGVGRSYVGLTEGRRPSGRSSPARTEPRRTMSAPSNGNGHAHGRFERAESTTLAHPLPPQNLEAEQGVLGSILLDNDV